MRVARWVLLAVAMAGCGDGARGARAAVAVDSVRPPDEALAVFRAGLPRTDSLAGGAESRDALLARFARAVAGRDTAAVRGMTLDRAEYAWIYFPSLRRMNPGTRMQPEVMWMLHRQESAKGITRVLRRLGGDQARLGGWTCEDTPRGEGGNRYWDGCTATVTAPGGDAAPLKLFGGVMERGGRYKIVSYANDF